MPENVKTRPRTNSRRATPDLDTPATQAVLAEAVVAADEQAPDAEARDGFATTPDAGLEDTPEDAAPVAPDGAVGWADAVPWLALRWGSPRPQPRCGSRRWCGPCSTSRPGPASSPGPG